MPFLLFQNIVEVQGAVRGAFGAVALAAGIRAHHVEAGDGGLGRGFLGAGLPHDLGQADAFARGGAASQAKDGCSGAEPITFSRKPMGFAKAPPIGYECNSYRSLIYVPKNLAIFISRSRFPSAVYFWSTKSCAPSAFLVMMSIQVSKGAVMLRSGLAAGPV